MDKSTDVLLLGTAAVGKSRLLHYLHVAARGVVSKKPMGFKNSEKKPVFIQSTVGVEVEYIALGKMWLRGGKQKPLRLREVGSPMIPMWNRYYNDTNSIVYVVDVSNRGLIAEAASELWKMLDDLNAQKIAVPILFVINKCESPSTLSRNELELLFRLQAIKQTVEHFSVIETDFGESQEKAVKSGEKVFKWVLETLAK